MATWGDTSTGEANVTLDNIWRAAGGLFSPGANKVLDSVHIRVASQNAPWRVAVYRNSSLTTNGATLVEDLGTFSGTASGTWATINSTSNPTLADGDYLFIAVKTDVVGGGNVRRDSSPNENLTYIAAGGGGVTTDPDVAWPATMTAPDATLSWSYSFYLTYSDPGGATGNPWYYYAQQ